ncbi:hypothetical protein D3C71_418480 [compost metagenome]
MTDTQNDSIKKKIRALLSKTVDNGVTEGEAMLAAAKAAELMEKYDIETADLEEPVESIGEATLDIDPAVSDALWRIGTAIGELCMCKFLVYQINRSKVVFVGYDSDREIAAYLMQVCARALKTETEAEDRRNNLYVHRVRFRKRLGFIEGMSTRLAERISRLAWKRKQGGTGLVVVKMDKINEHVGDIDSVTPRESIRDDVSWKNGRKKADSVHLSQAVGADDRVLTMSLRDMRND